MISIPEEKSIVPPEAFQGHMRNTVFTNVTIEQSLANTTCTSNKLNNVVFQNGLKNFVFHNSNFHGVVFSMLEHVQFIGCKFSDVIFNKNLDGCEFTDCNFNGISFAQGTCERTKFAQCELMQFSSEQRRFFTCSFENCEAIMKVQNSAFNGCTFKKTVILPLSIFSNTLFKTTSFARCTLFKIAFKECDFQKTSIKKCNLNASSMINCKTQSISFNETSMNQMSFDGSILYTTRFQECHVLKSSFKFCEITNTELKHGSFSYNDLQDAIITNIQFIFCATEDNHKKDTLFKNAENTKSVVCAIKCYLDEDSNIANQYTFTIQLLNNQKRVLKETQIVPINNRVEFNAQTSIVDQCVSISVNVVSNSYFTLPFSQNPECIKFKEIVAGSVVFITDAKGGYRKLKKISRERAHSF